MVAGLLLPPLVAAGLWFGVGEIALRSSAAFQISWLGLASVAASAIVLALLAGSRLSPIASLLGGLAFTALGVVPWIEMQGTRLLPDHLLPGAMETGFRTVSYSGVLAFLGVALLVASLFPSRWRSSAEPSAYPSAYDPAPSPYLPQHGPEDTTRPMFRD
ncbi:hypothetical protein FH608_023005 [Nonomuraea phyllanthi]|uniref:Uncharacterized protein n=1 Tax=Nonomuraea phyllanthi TaxID=2219224 RepID=A0A5C4WC37_9ACTN|nr:hypothetical protein [Nonomuraea phyllanthi]KAB8193176.1 hypothetical protein FH608_023005 [Nonomuraea phyllanthi]QFY10962.1 hypothetical protein GBF35_34055 [Nonomuraea phyllanthi]